VGAKAREIDGYKLWYSGSTKAKNGVAILVEKELADFVVEVRRKSDQIMAIKVLEGSVFVNVVSVYALHAGLPEDTKKLFLDDLDMVIQDVPRSGQLFIGGDFNGHIGADSVGYDTVHGGFGFGERNSEGVSMLDFVVAFDLLVVNSFFKKKEDHLVTFKSGYRKTQIDYFLMRTDSRRSCKDCKVIPSEYLGTRHRLLVLDAEFKCSKRKKRRVGDPRVKWCTLTKENAGLIAERITEEGAWRKAEDADSMWEALVDCIRRSAKEILGSSRRGGNKMEGAWWWNEEVKEKVKEKKEAYVEVMNSGSDEEREIKSIKYKAAKKVAKRAVAVAKSLAFDRLHIDWGPRRGRRKFLDWQGLGQERLGI